VCQLGGAPKLINLLKVKKKKGFIWNSDGYGDLSKHLAIKEAVRKFKLDFVVISETRRASFLVPFLANLVICPKRIYFPEPFCYCFSSNLCVLNTTNMD
jgi:hypothetical protein